MKGHHNHGNSYKENIKLWWQLTIPKFQSITIIVGNMTSTHDIVEISESPRSYRQQEDELLIMHYPEHRKC